ncbi:uncharacterized protein BBOV_IV009360 [Babesia bovis T2Bo]|uniref:RING-type domain-containing protein n=1 Tax=Babesia bovis TaxID=5865 RepID=A7ARX1_BABBO|nr:uncharacterized protein BBOV_IV009360 [Babesia bovis T2Bo]EDO07290.1 hypothetical protein BBOV_IV009360 [Babesia bovis T2Bo]|eukprot:XP_001610858.1 hypothetical protein [Babesia bovis T2Bo]
MGGGRRFPPKGGSGGHGGGPRNNTPTPYNATSPYTLFKDSLYDLMFDAYLQSKVSRRHGISRDQLEAIRQHPVSEHFHGYLCCSICYENALICAVGTCDHVMCFLCMMRLKNFYDDCNIFECPYCKQVSEILVICTNPFFTHACFDLRLYTQDLTPELDLSGLEKLLTILGVDTSKNRTYLSQDQINIKDLHNTFLSSSRDMIKGIRKPSDKSMQDIIQKTQQLSLEKREQRDPFHDVYNIRHPRPHFHGEMIFVPAHRMLFENFSIYMLFRAVSTALCWSSDCKATWLPPSFPKTKDAMEKAIVNLQSKQFTSFGSLNKHLKSTHGLVICDICQGYFRLKKYICEMPLYRQTDIKLHIKHGDPDSVPAVPPHMLCVACNRYQWDLTELKNHAKTDHFYCNICDSDGYTFDIYTDYAMLYDHYKTYHYPCEEPDCMFVVFPDDLQLHLHYMSKHPHRQRSSTARKPKPPPPNNEARTIDTRPSQYVCQINSTTLLWDGNIRIIKDCTVKCDESSAPPETPKLSKEFEAWLLKHPHLKDFSLTKVDNITDILDAFAGTLINLKSDIAIKEYDYDMFNVRCAIRVVSDLHRVVDILKIGKLPPRSSILEHLPADFQRQLDEYVMTLRTEYEAAIESSLSGEATAEQKPSLLNVVKKFLTPSVVFLYSIDLYEDVKLPRSFRVISEEHRVSPNGLLLFNTLGDMIECTNRIVVKQSFDWLLNALKESIARASEKKTSPASLSAMVKPKNKKKISLDVLEKGRSIAHMVDRQNQQRRQQRLLPHQERRPSAWGKVEPRLPEAEDKEPVECPTELTDGNTSLSLDNECYVMSVEDCFKQSLNSDFLTVMIKVIKSALGGNAVKYKASSTDYRLRVTTRLKLDQLVMDGPRRFTILSEFVPMQVLESLQALEPEFHRLVKESKHSDIDSLAKIWSSRCTYALRRCRVEHLEIIDYYLNAKTTAVELKNDDDFPVLGNGNAPQLHKTRRNYAQALNVRNSSKFVLLDSEFPALG